MSKFSELRDSSNLDQMTERERLPYFFKKNSRFDISRFKNLDSPASYNNISKSNKCALASENKGSKLIPNPKTKTMRKSLKTEKDKKIVFKKRTKSHRTIDKLLSPVHLKRCSVLCQLDSASSRKIHQIKHMIKNNNSYQFSIERNSQKKVLSENNDSKVAIPNLNCKKIPYNNYHEEFMSKLNEFSPSWRLALHYGR